MFDFHEKRKIRKVLYSWFFIASIFLLGGLVAYSAYGRFTVEQDMADKLKVREEELASLHERAASLQANVQHLSDERGIEEELRNRFDVAKEGEQVVVILDEDVGEVQTETEVDPSIPEKQGFIESFMNWIQGN